MSFYSDAFRSHRSTMRQFFAAVLTALALSSCSTVQPAQVAPVEVGIIAINDFHGALEPPKQSVFVPDGKGGVTGIPAGGAAWLASAVDRIRSSYRYSLTVAAGDLTGGSQFASSLFLDEPAIGVMNRIGLDFNAVGNHEFDRGWRELTRLQNGGCEKYTLRQPCAVEPQFGGAAFSYLAANVARADGTTLFPATALRTFGAGPAQVSVGIVGLTLKGTDKLVSPAGIEGLSFTDEAQAINRSTEKLKAAGADAVVVLLHQGGRTGGMPNPNGCEELSGEIEPIIGQLDPRVDLIVSGHTHWAYVCDYAAIDPARPLLLTSAGVHGELVTDISLTIDPVTGRVTGRQAQNVIVQSEPYIAGRSPVPLSAEFEQFAPRTDVAAYVASYTSEAAAFSKRPIGRLSGPAEKNGSEGGPAGNLIADAQLAATREAGAQIAFTNPFGVRAPLDPAMPMGEDTKLTPQQGVELTFGDIYKLQPFDNLLITQIMTGAEIKAALEEGFDEDGPEQHLSPSAGFRYWYDTSRAIGDRIVRIEFNGKPLDMEASYRVTTNSFLANGGDAFSNFIGKRDAVTGVSDIEALEAWIRAVPVREVPQEQRVIDARQ